MKKKKSCTTETPKCCYGYQHIKHALFGSDSCISHSLNELED